MKSLKNRFAGAYTLVELLVVIAVLTLLVVGGAAVIGQILWLVGQILWVVVQLLPLMFVIFFTIVSWQLLAKTLDRWELNRARRAAGLPEDKGPGFLARLFTKPAKPAPAPAPAGPATPPPAPAAPVG